MTNQETKNDQSSGMDHAVVKRPVKRVMFQFDDRTLAPIEDLIEQGRFGQRDLEAVCSAIGLEASQRKVDFHLHRQALTLSQMCRSISQMIGWLRDGIYDVEGLQDLVSKTNQAQKSIGKVLDELTEVVNETAPPV